MLSIISRDAHTRETSRIGWQVKQAEMEYCRKKKLPFSSAGGAFMTDAKLGAVYRSTDLHAFTNFMIKMPEMHLMAGSRLIDYGCGFGGVLFTWRRFFENGLGIERDALMVEMARRARENLCADPETSIQHGYGTLDFQEGDFLDFCPSHRDVIYVFRPFRQEFDDTMLRHFTEHGPTGMRIITHSVGGIRDVDFLSRSGQFVKLFKKDLPGSRFSLYVKTD